MLDGLDTSASDGGHGRDPAGDGRRPLPSGRALPRPSSCVEHQAQELLGALLLRVAEDLGGRALLDDDAAVHEDDAAGDVAGELHLVGDDDHRHPLGGELAHHVEDLLDQLGVERQVTSSKRITCGSMASARAIATRCCWPPERRSGYSLILCRHADPLEQRLRLRVALPSRCGRGPSPGRCDTFSSRGHVREEVELLEDHPDPPADEVDAALVVVLGAGDLLALEVDRARPPGARAG